MKIFIGADHNGYQMKAELIVYLSQKGYEVVDEGDKSFRADDDFPQYASRVVTALLSSRDPDNRAILICGSGQGMAIAANRYKGIRASLVWDVTEARLSRNDDDCNVLCIASRMVGQRQAEVITDAWLTTLFAAAPRFIRRIRELDELG